MSDRESYAAPVELGSVMVGGTVSQVKNYGFSHLKGKNSNASLMNL
jgi:NADPH-dependent curcumin reductase CurA